MQIKRFEAADMTEALRLVKREFGDDAVILSAKEVRQRGFFSALRKKHVEIRAATDYPADGKPKDNAFSGLLARQLDAVSQTDRVSLSASTAPGKRVGEHRRPSETFRDKADPSADGFEGGVASSAWVDRPSDGSSVSVEGFDAVQWTLTDAHPAASDEPAGGDGPGRMVAEPFFRTPTGRQVIALVGPPGSGKSTVTAKLAWRCRVVEKQRVGLISLDRFRVAANRLLQRVAAIMDLPLEVVHDVGEMQAALARLEEVDVVLIDTPGIGCSDASTMEAVCRLLDHARPDETHLVVNATIRREVIATMAGTFSPAGPDRLLLTHWDENGGGRVVDVLEQLGIPGSFYSDGIDLFDDLKTTAAEAGTHEDASRPSAPGRVTDFPGGGRQRISATADEGAPRYLANRNSELFHQPTCKSVKRINARNIAAFDSIEQAVDAGFKPCRACCDIRLFGQAVPADPWRQRARAM